MVCTTSLTLRACISQGHLVYVLLAGRRTVKIQAHEDDVNSCCWADMGSNVLISASDDTFIKVWYVLGDWFL